MTGKNDLLPYFYLMADMNLSIIIPAYNEAPTLRTLLDKVISVKLIGDIQKEIIIVDDASSDNTKAVVDQYKIDNPDTNIYYYKHDINQGKGGAIHTGIAKATGDFVLVQDADLEYDPSDYNSLLKPVLDNKADIVYGTRFGGEKPHRILFFWHTIGNKFLTFLSNMLSNLNLTDMENGFKLFRRSILNSITLEEKRFGFEPEVTAKTARIPGIRIYEVGIAYYGRTYQEGKKISWKDGMKAIYCILKYNLFTRTDQNKSLSWHSRIPLLATLLFFLAGLILVFTARGTADEGC